MLGSVIRLFIYYLFWGQRSRIRLEIELKLNGPKKMAGQTVQDKKCSEH